MIIGSSGVGDTGLLTKRVDVARVTDEGGPIDILGVVYDLGMVGGLVILGVGIEVPGLDISWIGDRIAFSGNLLWGLNASGVNG